jgi:hypothetical protein
MRAMEIRKSVQRSIARASCSAPRDRLRGARCSGGRCLACGNSTCPRENSSRLYIGSPRPVGCEQPRSNKALRQRAVPRRRRGQTAHTLCGQKDRWPGRRGSVLLPDCLFEAAPPAAGSEDPNDKAWARWSPMSARGISAHGRVLALSGGPRRAESRYHCWHVVP